MPLPAGGKAARTMSANRKACSENPRVSIRVLTENTPHGGPGRMGHPAGRLRSGLQPPVRDSPCVHRRAGICGRLLHRRLSLRPDPWPGKRRARRHPAASAGAAHAPVLVRWDAAVFYSSSPPPATTFRPIPAGTTFAPCSTPLRADREGERP